jgi:hypothetical protein
LTGLLALVLFAQMLFPTAAYTTADPVDPSRVGLATLTGRYSITLGDGCDQVVPMQNVEVVTNSADSSATLDGDCQIVLGPRMSVTPCFLNDVAMCDVAAELAAE